MFNTIFYKPLYNALVFLVDVLPGGNIGLAIVILTLVVKFALFPLSQKSITAQANMRKLEPELKKIKEKYKDQQEQAKQTMELYKKTGINPFSGCFLLLLQLPIIFALYYVFFQGLKFDTSMMYSFVHKPAEVNMWFLGLDLAQKSILLGLLAAITQYYQLHLSVPSVPKAEPGKELTFQEEFSRNMSLQMKYIFPVMVFFIAYSISSAIALYWIVSNLFSIGQELYVKKSVKS